VNEDATKMMNKKKIEDVLFTIALHMRQCPTCLETVLTAGDARADPNCPEYQRLKGIAKKLAGK
jgi:hypothetical protein